MDRQNRVGSKFGGGGVLPAQQAGADRRDRLRKLAMETIDLNKDPYLFRNHLGSLECKLCGTIHPNEGNYLAHTQGRRHQTNLSRRANREAKDRSLPLADARRTVAVRKTIKIGRPGYKVVKTSDPDTSQRGLVFELVYPEIESGMQPRHRIMSAFEQRVGPKDRRYQYILFAGEPYETVGFRIPNRPLDKRPGRFTTEWDRDSKTFRLQLFFASEGAKTSPSPKGSIKVRATRPR